MIEKKVLILHAPGTNRDGDLADAILAAGGAPQIVPLSELAQNGVHWQNYAMLALPGGFSYGDALGAGRLWALELETIFHDFVQAFVKSGKPVIGICNGFQALVKTGILPGDSPSPSTGRGPGGGVATLTFNQSGHFECRWATLVANAKNDSPWLDDLPPILCPVAHGEGRFLMAAGSELPAQQIALTYTHPNGSPANGEYPLNPNGSPQDIAGITNPAGNVLGLMPHPENHIHPYQHPRWTRGEVGGMGIQLFKNGLAIG